MRSKRYGVVFNDEAGTLFRPDGTMVPHTWSVVDRADRDSSGNPREVANYDTRAEARREARDRNDAEAARVAAGRKPPAKFVGRTVTGRIAHEGTLTECQEALAFIMRKDTLALIESGDGFWYVYASQTDADADPEFELWLGTIAREI